MASPPPYQRLDEEKGPEPSAPPSYQESIQTPAVGGHPGPPGGHPGPPGQPTPYPGSSSYTTPYPAQAIHGQESHSTLYPVPINPYPQIPVTAQPAMHTVVISRISFGSQPVAMQCHYCHTFITTVVTRSVGLKVWLWALIIFLLGGALGCCLIPFCVPACWDADHECPNCHTHLGRSARSI